MIQVQATSVVYDVMAPISESFVLFTLKLTMNEEVAQRWGTRKAFSPVANDREGQWFLDSWEDLMASPFCVPASNVRGKKTPEDIPIHAQFRELGGLPPQVSSALFSCS